MRSNLIGLRREDIPTSPQRRAVVDVDTGFEYGPLDPNASEATPTPKRRTDIEDLIYQSYEDKRRTDQLPHRVRLGASDIGNECARAVWYTFRHAQRKDFEGRLLRLFQRGSLEEPVIEDDFKRIGIPISATSDGTRQHAFTDATGHFRVHLDGVIQIEGKQLLVEEKTMSRFSFKKLEKMGGVRYSHPNYYAQIHAQAATAEKQIKVDGALFVAVCKDTDELWIEELEIDQDAKKAVMERAQAIIGGIAPPPMDISPNAPPCKWCDYKSLCRDNRYDLIEKNCRTCNFAVATNGGQWKCDAGEPFGTPCDKWAQHRSF